MTARLFTRWTALSVTLAGIASCVFITDTCACVYPPPYVLWVSGTVKTASGAALPVGTYVRGTAYDDTCPSVDPTQPENMTHAIVDATGRFRMDLRRPTPAANVCVRVRAYRGVGDQAPVTIERTGLRIALGTDGKPLDALDLSIVLP